MKNHMSSQLSFEPKKHPNTSPPAPKKKESRKNSSPQEEIRFALGTSCLGSVLVAYGYKGVCAVFLSDNCEEMKNDLQKRFSKASLIEDTLRLEKTLNAIIAFIENPLSRLDIPFDNRGTPFQKLVWQALTEIPFGKTMSYTEIARKIGFPKACRAVAQACGANALAVVVPCHRVIRQDGSLSGYRWGVEVKKRLLSLESKHT